MASTSTAAPVAAAKVPNATTTARKSRSSSNGSMGSQGSETGRLLKSLGSVDGFADIGTGLEPSGAPVAAAAPPLPVAATAKAPTESKVEEDKDTVDDSKTFPVPASVPQHEHDKKPAPAANSTDVPMEDRKPAAAPAPPAEVILHVSFPKDLKPTMEESEGNSKQQQQGGGHSRSLPERRMQPKKRKMSYESYDTGLGDHTHSSSSFSMSKRKMSYESYGSAPLADSKDSNNSNSNFSRRKMSYESYGSAMGDISLGLESLDSDIIQKQPPDVGSVATKESLASDKSPPAPHLPLPTLGVSALDHLDALGDDRAEAGTDDAGLPPPAPVAGVKKAPEDAPIIGNASIIRDAEQQQEEADENATTSDATFTSSGHRLLMEAITMTNGGTATSGGRKRLESWGGMSDLSFQPAGGTTGHDHHHHRGGGGGVDAATAIAASALQHTGLIDDVMAAANFGADSEASSVTDDLAGAKARSSSLELFIRERKESTTSFSDGTFALPGSMASDGVDISSDLQKFVSQAVASVGDQLAELAGNIESAVEVVDLDKQHQYEEASQASKGSQSTATPLTALVLGASLDDPSRVTISGQSTVHQAGIERGESRKNVEEAAASAAAISVDYDAVAAAVDAANAAIGGLDLSSIGNGAVPGATASHASVRKKNGKFKLPLAQNRKRGIDKISFTASMHLLGDVPKSSLSEKEQDEIRERARRAAGYVPPSQLPNGALKTPAKNHRALPPLKKRIKRATPEPGSAVKSMSYATPKVSNVSGKGPLPSPVLSSTPQSGSSKSGGKEKSTQKWDSMYDCLLKFVVDQKKEETAGFTAEELAEWSWDGNVPTTYKTKDGKALGRWINNQRSAKSKGTLKGEREQRLVNAGLKWSVLASNSWNEMLDELRIYIKEYIKEGKKWDGNVPTNYRIKARANGKKMTEEDKNLGRWVNRQRSLYQAGKLRKDRQLALEKVGLKWSMLATTSWDSMYDTLLVYVREKRNRGIKWDGNVPANFKTDDNPPRALGRWINRQRSAHVKKKLKKEYVDKLTLLGLKWSVHERKYNEDARGDELEDNEDIIPENATSDNAAQPPALVLSGASLSASIRQIPVTVAVPAVNAQLKPPPVVTGKANNCDIRPDQVSSELIDVGDQLSPSSQDTVKGNNKHAQVSSEAKDHAAEPPPALVVKIGETSNKIPVGTTTVAASVPTPSASTTPTAPIVTTPSSSAASSSQRKPTVSQPEPSEKPAETKAGGSESVASEGATAKHGDSVANEASSEESKATSQDTENSSAAPVTVALSTDKNCDVKCASKSQTQEAIPPKSASVQPLSEEQIPERKSMTPAAAKAIIESKYKEKETPELIETIIPPQVVPVASDQIGETGSRDEVREKSVAAAAADESVQDVEKLSASEGVDLIQSEQAASLPEEADVKPKEAPKPKTVNEAKAATIKSENSPQVSVEATKDSKSPTKTLSSEPAPETLAVDEKEDANFIKLPGNTPMKASVVDEDVTSEEGNIQAPVAKEIPEDGASTSIEEDAKIAEETAEEFTETRTPSVAKEAFKDEASPLVENGQEVNTKQTTEATPASDVPSVSQTLSTRKKGAKASKHATEKGVSVIEVKGKTKGKAPAPRRMTPSRKSRANDKPVEKRSTPRRSTRSR